MCKKRELDIVLHFDYAQMSASQGWGQWGVGKRISFQVVFEHGTALLEPYLENWCLPVLSSGTNNTHHIRHRNSFRHWPGHSFIFSPVKLCLSVKLYILEAITGIFRKYSRQVLKYYGHFKKIATGSFMLHGHVVNPIFTGTFPVSRSIMDFMWIFVFRAHPKIR